jgi:hypothetical protein
MGKILFLGHEGSGKTVLMTMLSRYFEMAGDGHWGLDPQTEAAFAFMEQAPAKIAKGKWPQQTTVDKIVTYRWELQYAGACCTTLEMLEYPGEVFRHLFDESAPNKALYQEECTILTSAIHNANSIFLLINLDDLKDTSENRKNVQTIWQLCQAVKYLSSLNTQPQITLVLTQIDRYCDNPENINPTNLLLSKNSLFLKRGFQNYNIIAISAVGKTIKDTHGHEVPDIKNTHPYGLSKLIYDCLQGTFVEQEIHQLIETCSSVTKEINTPKTTSASCAASINALNMQSKAIMALLNKYGYLLEDNIRLNAEKTLRLANGAVTSLRKFYQEFLAKEEVARKQQEEERKRQEEANRKRQEEVRKRQEEERKQQESRKRYEEECKRQEEARKRQEEEAKRKHLEAEEAKRRRLEAEEAKRFFYARICAWSSFVILIITIILVCVLA